MASKLHLSLQLSASSLAPAAAGTTHCYRPSMLTDSSAALASLAGHSTMLWPLDYRDTVHLSLHPRVRHKLLAASTASADDAAAAVDCIDDDDDAHDQLIVVAGSNQSDAGAANAGYTAAAGAGYAGCSAGADDDRHDAGCGRECGSSHVSALNLSTGQSLANTRYAPSSTTTKTTSLDSGAVVVG